MNSLKDFSSHYIICGFDKIGRGICYILKEEEIPFVVIDPKKEAFEYASIRDYDIINDDPTSDATLIAAGIENAVGIVACTNSDSDNLYITLAARELKNNIKIITCSSDPSLESRMKRAGADSVVYPEYLGGEEIAKIIHKEPVDMNVVSRQNIQDINLYGYSLRIYKHLSEELIKVKDISEKISAAAVIGVVRNDITHFNNLMDFELVKNDSLILAVSGQDNNNMNYSKDKLIKWNSDYSVNILSLDKEHKTILDIINRINMILEGNNSDSLGEVLDELLDYAIEHFDHEEKLFIKFNYAEKDEHTTIHRDLIARIRELRSQAKSIHPETILVFLKSWIKHHFCVVDKRYSEFFISKNVK